jgi:DNA-binding beta-propeller fold protein YncE
MDGYGTNSLSRYTPDGKPLAFEALGSNKLPTGVYRGYGPNMGLRGHCVAPNGDIYLIRSNNYGLEDGTAARVDLFGPDGKLKKGGLVQGLGSGDCGLAVDAAGNVYVGLNVKSKEQPYPEAFMGKVSAEPYVWWRKGKREVPWHYMYSNPYLYHWGSVLKFGPEGGTVYGHVASGSKEKPPALASAAGAPAGAESLVSGYLARELKITGMKWRYPGCGIIPTSDVNWGDPACVCMTSHLAGDEYGRVFAPNPFRFSVEMLDTAGNQLSRIGRYGNADSAGPGGKAPEPEIAFAWPVFVSTADGKVYVADPDNRRVTVVKFDHAAEETCEVK